MRSPLKEVSFERLRAQYAELLRLREYVERIENLCATANPNGTADGASEYENPSVNAAQSPFMGT